MKKFLFSLILLTAIAFAGIAGDISRKERIGDKYYRVYAFDKAIEAYTNAKNLSIDGQRKLAASYKNLNQNIESEAAYKVLIDVTGGKVTEDLYNYASVLRTNGKYDEAAIWIDKFFDAKPTDLRALDYAANKTAFVEFSKESGKYKVEHMNMNTEAQDFGTCYYKNQIVFASSGSVANWTDKTYNWNRKHFLDLYVSDLEGTALKAPVEFDKNFNKNMHEGPASFNKEGTFIAFTRNYYDGKKKDPVVRIEICFSNFTDGKWSTPEPFILNNASYSVGQPCLSADGNTMFFSSDMPGGFGGADIYKISKTANGKWENAVNMGDKVNTESDELFPFYEEGHSTLFFASNGRYGLGGLDIFIAEMNDAKIVKVYNAGYPLNTQWDDFAVLTNDQMTTGYFSSNRSGGSGDDDIYSVEFLKTIDSVKRIAGVAKDKNGILLDKVLVTLMNDKDSILEMQTTGVDAAYLFVVASDRNYKLIGTKENYINGTTTANTSGKEGTVIADLVLLDKEEIIAEKIKEPRADLAIILELKNIYFDLDKSNIRPDAEVELEKIVKTMNKYPNMVVELGAYADCRADKSYNQQLSDRRAKSSANYIRKRITTPDRIYGKGYGETNSLNSCNCEGDIVSTCTEEQFQSDRRTEFIIVKNVLINKTPLTER